MADSQTFFNFRTVCMFILAKIGRELNDNDFTKSYKFMTETGFTKKPVKSLLQYATTTGMKKQKACLKHERFKSD